MLRLTCFTSKFAISLLRLTEVILQRHRLWVVEGLVNSLVRNDQEMALYTSFFTKVGSNTTNKLQIYWTMVAVFGYKLFKRFNVFNFFYCCISNKR